MDLSVTPDRDGPPPVYPLEFWTSYVSDPANPAELKAVDWVRWMRKGSANASTEEKVSRLVKANGPVWQVLKPYFEAWKKGEDEPVSGTPFSTWPGISKDAAKILQQYQLRSVEDLAEASDSVITKVPLPGIRDLQRKAKAFAEAARDRSVIEGAIAERDAKLEAQSAEIEALREAVAALKASLDSDDTPRGRKAKG